MTEPAHYKRGPSGSHEWLICTDSPEAQEPYPDETCDAADEGTAAHWLLEQCLRQDISAQGFIDFLPAEPGICVGAGRAADGNAYIVAGEETGCINDWPITGEMIEAVQLAIDEVEKQSKKRGTKIFVEERVFIPAHYGLKDTVGGTADIIMYLPKSKTLYVLDFKYGKGHVVEVEHKDFNVNPQVGLYVIAVIGELERLLGKKAEVKWIIAGIIQPRAYHKKGPVRIKKLHPNQLMNLEIALIQAVNGPRFRKAGGHCHYCRAKPDCEPYHQWRHENAVLDFEGELPEAIAAGHTGDDYPEATGQELVTYATEPEVPALIDAAGLLPRPVKGLTRHELSVARGLATHVKKWAEEVAEEVRTRLLHDIAIPGAKLAQGKGSRAYGGSQEDIGFAVTQTCTQLGLAAEALYEPAKLKSPAQLEKELGKAKFQGTSLATLVAHTAGGPVVVDADSDKPDYVKGGGFEAEVPPEETTTHPLL